MRKALRRVILAGYDWTACVAFCGIALPVLWILEPFKPVRIGRFAEHHIGHLSMEPELLMRQRQLDPIARRKKLVFFVLNPANHQLFAMWKRHIQFVEGRWGIRAFEAVRPLLERTRFHQPRPTCCVALPGGDMCHEILVRARPSLSFSPEEEARGRAELRKMGVPEGAWFAVFHVRDAAYYAAAYGTRNAVHNFRDVPLETFHQAMTWVAENGGYALRIGASVERPLPDLGPRVIDYSVRYWSDFMDIYLIAKARFFIATNSGLFSVAQIFDVPLAITNMFPYPNVPSGKGTIYIPMLLRDKKDGHVLSFAEIKRRKLLQCPSEEFYTFVFTPLHENLGLEMVPNDAQDVTNLCMDILDQVEGRMPDPEARRLQDRYRSLYEGVDAGPYAGRLSPRFALRYAHLIEPEHHSNAAKAAAGSLT